MANNPIVIWHTGQSNAWGGNLGESTATPSVSYWDTLLGEVSPPPTTSFHTLHGTSGVSGHVSHGADATIGKLLANAGYDVIIINISKGSTYSYTWIPGGAAWDQWAAESAAAWAALRALRPGATFRHIHVRDQGTSDMRLGTTGGFPAIVAAWASNTQIMHENLEALVGQPVTKVCWLSHSQLTQAGVGTPVANWAQEIRAQQRLWAGNANCIDGDSCEIEADIVHLTTAGYIQSGGLISAKIQELFPMGSFSTYAKNVQLNHELNVAAHTPAANHHMHLYAAGGVPLTPGNAPGYTVTTFANNTTSWPAPSGRVSANGIELITTTPSGDWPDVVEARITTSATEGAGEIILSDTFGAMSFNLGTGPFRYAVGALTVTCPTAGFVDAIAHRMMGLVLGGTTYTAPAQKWISYYAGNPQSGGTIAGSRVAMTMASTFGSASSGYSYTSAAISLPHQATGTYIAVHDAAAAGNLVFSGTRPDTLGLSGTIPAGTLRIGIP